MNDINLIGLQGPLSDPPRREYLDVLDPKIVIGTVSLDLKPGKLDNKTKDNAENTIDESGSSEKYTQILQGIGPKIHNTLGFAGIHNFNISFPDTSCHVIYVSISLK